MSEKHYNPHYLAYCRWHGRSPQEQWEQDTKDWPGGRMAGFILWINDRRAEFRKMHPEAWIGSAIADIELWSSFLESQTENHINHE